jgi:predicted  nucleic acid-binding Zn-ribbon protein
MSTITRWEYRKLNYAHEFPQATAMVAEITELREALKVAQEENLSITNDALRFVKERDALQAKLSAIEAQEPHSWYSAQEGEWMPGKTRKDHARLNTYSHKFGGFDMPLYAAHVAPAQPLTKEQDADVEYWRKKYQALDKLYDELEKEKEAIEQNYRAIT